MENSAQTTVLMKEISKLKSLNLNQTDLIEALREKTLPSLKEASVSGYRTILKDVTKDLREGKISYHEAKFYLDVAKQITDEVELSFKMATHNEEIELEKSKARNIKAQADLREQQNITAKLTKNNKELDSVLNHNVILNSE